MDNAIQRIRGFDGLRAIAITLVYLEHRAGIPDKMRLLIGVWLFLVLSGYLITSIVLKQRSRIENGMGTPAGEWLEFFIKRSFRILPAYLFFICSAFLLFGSSVVSRDWILAYLTFTTNVVVEFFATDWPGLGHLWSLAVEEQFYLIAAPLFLFLPMRRHRAIVAAIIALGMAALVLAIATGIRADGIWADSLVNFAVLGAGSALAVYKVTPAAGTSSHSAILGLLCLIIAPSLSLAAQPAIGFASDQILFHLCAIFAVLCVAGVLKNQQSRIVKILELAPLRSLGLVSYSFYLWHFPIHLPRFTQTLLGPSFTAAAVDMALEFSFVWCIAILSHRLIEMPFLSIRDDLLGRLRWRKPATLAANP